MSSPHVDDEKGKKAMVYKERKRKGKGGREKKKSDLKKLVRRDATLGSMFVS